MLDIFSSLLTRVRPFRWLRRRENVIPWCLSHFACWSCLSLSLSTRKRNIVFYFFFHLVIQDLCVIADFLLKERFWCIHCTFVRPNSSRPPDLLAPVISLHSLSPSLLLHLFFTTSIDYSYYCSCSCTSNIIVVLLWKKAGAEYEATTCTTTTTALKWKFAPFEVKLVFFFSCIFDSSDKLRDLNSTTHTRQFRQHVCLYVCMCVCVWKSERKEIFHFWFRWKTVIFGLCVCWSPPGEWSEKIPSFPEYIMIKTLSNEESESRDSESEGDVVVHQHHQHHHHHMHTHTHTVIHCVAGQWSPRPTLYHRELVKRSLTHEKKGNASHKWSNS